MESSRLSDTAAPAPAPPAALGPRRPPLRFGLRALGIEQGLRLLGCLAALLAARVADALVDLVSGPERRAERRARRQTRGARRVAQTLGALKGPFAKAGQFGALRYDVLPEAARAPLASLRDRVPPLPLRAVRALVEAELGAPLERLFAHFEAEPLGAASIAQVHRATLHSGEAVAVKVQYPWLRHSLRADLFLLRAVLALALRRRAGTALDRDRLFREFADGVREELDFRREAQVADSIGRNLAADPQIVVPRVVAQRSTGRVLTMTYHAAVSIRDRDGLRRLGVAASDVLAVIARAYAKQVFVDGLFHADPHPGNLFVLDEPGAARRPRVLFVDFGLARRLDPGLRREIRRGIYALLQRDLEAFVGGMQRLEMIAPGAEPSVRASVSTLFEGLGGGEALSLADAEVVSLKDRAKALLQEIEGVRLPNDLLLYAKTLSYLFGLGAELAPDVDLMRLCTPYLVQFLAERSGEPPPEASVDR
ncbi:MAG: AarF/ABC1/UbiB kinase family protein [Deltaproteobacteria bacterium]|nr:MAG: AarF/ABC1/UbiB kinase family protein [Deltaproteobacteria bacterium]